MSAQIDQILADVLRLSVEERSAVAAALIDSLETAQADDLAQAWRVELRRRRDELRSGSVQATPWAQVRARMSGA